MIPSLVLGNIKAIFGDNLILPDYINLCVSPKEAWQGTEHDLQTNFFKWLAELRLNDPYLHLAHAIPNGGLRDKITASRLVAEGVKTGIPDVFIPIPRQSFDGFNRCYHGLYIEFKDAKGKPSEDQRAMLLMLDRLGYKVIVVNCFEVAKAQFNLYYYG